MYSNLPIKIARIITFAAIFFAILASLISYFYTQSVEIKASKTTLKQLFFTVEGSAAIAAYIENRELATEVVESLAMNDIVARASITSLTGMTVESGAHAKPMSKSLIFPIYDPFIPTEQVGELQIQPNHAFIENRAQTAALENVLILIIQTLVIAALVLWLVQRIFIRPIISIAEDLHKVTPGDNYQLDCPKGHEKDEIGNLISDVNRLLASTRSTIQQERILRNKIEYLEKHFRLIFDRASAGIFLLDKDLKITSANQAFKKLSGIVVNERRVDKQDAYLPNLFYEPETVYDILHNVLNNGRQAAYDLRLGSLTNEQWLHCLFSTVKNDDGEVLIEGLVIDITERTFQMEQILFESKHDPLTKLLNRRAGKQLLNVMLMNARNENNQLALLLIDLDGFKQINDTYGHKAGDKVLVDVSNCMQSAIRKEDVLFRLGGDEFIIALIPSGKYPDEINFVINKLLEQFDTEFTLNSGQHVTIGASIGIALFPKDGENIETLISKADSAMYQAKREEKKYASCL